MSKAMPVVGKFMMHAPHTIGHDQTLAQATELMHRYDVRHLPVLSGGKLAGMLTARDIALIESLRDVNPVTELVSDAMSSEVYSVSPEAALDEVVTEMAKMKYGSAVIVQNNKVVGVFTTVDVCRALAELLHSRLA